MSDQFEPRTLADDVVLDDTAPPEGWAIPSATHLNTAAAPILDGGNIPGLNDQDPVFNPPPAISTDSITDLGPTVNPDEWTGAGTLGAGGMPPVPMAATVVDDRTWQPVYFAYNQDFIGDAGQRQLEQLADYLSRNNQFHLVLEGHCDERGSEGYNRSLGERRAIAVMNYLVALGVTDGRMKTISYGEERPAAGGAGESVWRQNRRAEIIVVDPR